MFNFAGSPESTLPVGWPGRVIMFSWYLAVLVLTATYTGNLVAFLTVMKEPVPFETLEDLANQDQYKFGVLGGSSWVGQFNVSCKQYM